VKQSIVSTDWDYSVIAVHIGKLEIIIIIMIVIVEGTLNLREWTLREWTIRHDVSK